MKTRFRISDESGLTLVEVVAALVILSLLAPAVFTSYNTAMSAANATLDRLRTVNAAREVAEAFKQQGYDDTTYASVSAGDTLALPDSISLDADIQVSAKVPDDYTTSVGKLAVAVTTSKGNVTTTLDFLIVRGGI